MFSQAELVGGIKDVFTEEVLSSSLSISFIPGICKISLGNAVGEKHPPSQDIPIRLPA